MLLILLAFLGLFQETSAAKSPPTPSPIEQVTFDRLEQDTVYFKAPEGAPLPQPLKTNLFDLSYLGILKPSEGGAPYFLFTGKPCQSCLDDKAIYALRPNSTKPTTFVSPGKIIDPKNKGLLLESRAFYGKCLPRRGDVYVAFQKERVDRKRGLQPSVFVAEAGKDYFDENLIERRLPSVKTTEQLVKRKTCWEIAGRNRLMLSKPLDLHPRANVDSDDDSDEDNSSPSDKSDEKSTP
jgi:hypothetical protein